MWTPLFEQQTLGPGANYAGMHMYSGAVALYRISAEPAGERCAELTEGRVVWPLLILVVLGAVERGFHRELAGHALNVCLRPNFCTFGPH